MSEGLCSFWIAPSFSRHPEKTLLVYFYNVGLFFSSGKMVIRQTDKISCFDFRHSEWLRLKGARCFSEPCRVECITRPSLPQKCKGGGAWLNSVETAGQCEGLWKAQESVILACFFMCFWWRKCLGEHWQESSALAAAPHVTVWNDFGSLLGSLSFLWNDPSRMPALPRNTRCNECWPWKCLEGFLDMIVFQLVFSGNTFHLAGLFIAECCGYIPPFPPTLPSFLAFFPFSFLHYKQQPNRILNPWNQGKRDSVFWHDVMARFREAFSTVCLKFQNFSHQYKMYETHKLTEEPLFLFFFRIRGLFPSH